MNYDATYDKISSNVGFYGNLVLKHEVKLNKVNNMDKTREFFHREYEYDSKVYSDTNSLRKIDLSFRSYLLLAVNNNKDLDWSDRKQIYITTSNEYTLIRQLERMERMFYDNESMFLMDGDKLILSSDFKKPTLFKMNNNTIRLEPTVFVDDSNESYEAVNIYINDTNNFSVLTLSQLGNLIFTLKSINIYSAGLQLINYFGRPENGTNLTNMSNNPNKKQNSYFSNAGTSGQLPKGGLNAYNGKLKI